LLATITNNLPGVNQSFGAALAALGTDRLLIGAPGASVDSPGSACLFTTNGTLLRRFHDPNGLIGSQFGGALAVLGSDRLIITAPQANVGAPIAGAANLFNTNGQIIAPLFNPEPDFLDQFGIAVAVVDDDKILIGSNDQRTALNGGGAYLYATNGALLMRINQPVSEFSRLGNAVADLGAGRVLLGAYDLNLVGAAYVYDLTPTLQIAPAPGGAVSVSWASAWTGWTLQQNMNLNSTHWTTASESVTDNGTNRFILVSPPAGNRFYRLAKP
jgi:hypothetical protein